MALIASTAITVTCSQFLIVLASCDVEHVQMSIKRSFLPCWGGQYGLINMPLEFLRTCSTIEDSLLQVSSQIAPCTNSSRHVN
ncbi:hypothetical protein EDD16DRAFT_1555064 [Pisolithus croceorrhizus]|nr:hypothetical protein EDD16DRAFT_1555064 [Pisolithus croceorrhizus]